MLKQSSKIFVASSKPHDRPYWRDCSSRRLAIVFRNNADFYQEKNMTAITVSANELGSIAKSREFLSLCKAVFDSMAFAQITREKVDSYAVPLFQSMNFTYSHQDSSRREGLAGKQIMDPKFDYCCDDDVLYEEYIELLHEEHIKHGFKVAEKGICPALVAESSLIKTEQLLLQYMQEEIGMPEWNTLEMRKQLLDLYLSMGAQNMPKTIAE
jgi:hypothetical protein